MHCYIHQWKYTLEFLFIFSLISLVCFLIFFQIFYLYGEFQNIFHSLFLEKLMSYGLGKWSFKICGEITHRPHSESNAINSPFSSQQPFTCRVPQQKILDPILFNMFINDFSNGIKWWSLLKTLNWVGKWIDTSEERDTLQKEFSRLEEQTNKNEVKFS